MVMKEPVQASPAQMALFSRLYPLNARPVQPGSGRVVKESN
jgi:carbonic anhydrase